MRYFFDVRINSSTKLDFTGRILDRPEQARELADLLAIDIACSEEETVGCEVLVRNTAGILFSVVSGDPIAA